MSFQIETIARNRSQVDADRSGLYIHYLGSGVPYTQMTTPMDTANRVMSDYVVPGFKQLSRAGYVVFNPCTYTVITEVATQGSYRAYRTSDNSLAYYSGGDGSVARFYNATYGASVPILNVSDSAAALAKSSAIAAIDRTPYAFAEDVGELVETLKFLRNPAESLVKLSHSFRKARLKREKSLLRRYKRSAGSYWRQFQHEPRLQALSDVWLAYRFAFSPLLRSFVSLHEALGKSVRRPKRSSARGNAQDSGAYHGTADHLPFTWGIDTTVDLSVKASILYEVSNPVVDVFYKYGLRLKDVPVTLWALCPYSFMVDRVLNVSKAISGLTNLADPSVTILGATVTTRSNLYWKRTLLKQQSSGYNVTISDASITHNQYSYTRVVWEPGIKDTIPPFTAGNLVRDAKSIADLITLVYKNIR